MKLSKIFSKLNRELEIQVAGIIASLMQENKWKEMAFRYEGGGFDMSFYPHTMCGLKLKEEKFNYWIVEAICKDDPNGAVIEHELFDNGIIPLADLLVILEEVEDHIEYEHHKH